MKPIRITGAGLAGLTLGTALRAADIPVRIDEAGTLPRHRVCGEFLCGRGAEVLRGLGLGETLEGALPHRDVHWHAGGRRVLAVRLPAPALGLSRHRLDQRLAFRFRALGGDLRLRSRLPADHAPAPGEVRCHGRRPTRSPWIGLKLHAEGLPMEADLEMHLGDHAYVGLCGVEDGRVNVCGLFRRRPDIRAPKHSALPAYLRASGLSELADRLAEGAIDPASHAGVAGITFRQSPPAPSSGAPALGDAGGVIPPFTGNGMSVAIESAAIARPVLEAYARGETSWATARHTLRTELRRALRSRMRAAQLMHPFLHNPALRRTAVAAARLRLLPFRFLFRQTH